MKIVIMCGGRGRRLGRLGDNVPKPLMKFNDKTILELKIEEYVKQGFNDFVFCVGYKGELIQKVVSGFNGKISAEFSNAGEEAGILERLNYAKELCGDQLLMTYGDTFTDIKLSNFIIDHKKSDNLSTIVVAPIQNPFGLVEFDHKYKVTFFKEKPILNYYIGYAIIDKSVFDLLPVNVIKMRNGEGLVTCYRILMAMDKLGVFYHSGLEITFNTESELRSAEEKFIRFFTMSEEKEENE